MSLYVVHESAKVPIGRLKFPRKWGPARHISGVENVLAEIILRWPNVARSSNNWFARCGMIWLNDC